MTTLGVPALETYYIQKNHKRLMETTAMWSDTSKKTHSNVNVLVKGDQGTGKSDFAQQFAANYQRPFSIIEVGLIAEPSALFGKVDLVNNTTVWTPSLFTNAIQTPNCVVHLQEINRPENDRILNGIFSVLDSKQRALWNDDLQQWIRVAPGVVFFASLNEGYQFIGTVPMDSALEDRFKIKLKLGVLPAKLEEELMMARTGIRQTDANRLVQSINNLRGNGETPVHVSTRNALDAADFMVAGHNMTESLLAVLAVNEDNMETIAAALHFGGQLTNIDIGSFETW